MVKLLSFTRKFLIHRRDREKLSVGDVSRADVDALEKLLVEECPSIPLDFQKRTIGIPAKNSGIILRPFNGGAYGAAVDFRHAGKLD